MPGVYKQQIMKLLAHREYSPLAVAKLARTLAVSEEEYPDFKAAVDELRKAGSIVLTPEDKVSLPPLSGTVIGTFRSNPKGFGFVVPQDPHAHGDLFIPPPDTGEAMNGDTVEARVKKKGRRAGQTRYNGKIIRILERAHNRFVGTLRKTADGWLVIPDGSALTEPVTVADVGAKDARADDKVLVEILAYPSKKYFAQGVIIEVLGKAGKYESEIESVIRQFHLPHKFDKQVLDHAHKGVTSFDAEKNGVREDITGKVVITIDPPDARDFDDAISIETDKQGNTVLGVHIADVSEFVTTDSPLDIEARDRGNSVYLTGRVIPMLPEILSNGVCSLQPEQLRFAKSAYITYERDAKVVARRFANSLIKSTQRLTYTQADAALKGKTEGIKPEVLDLLKKADALARNIEKRRRKQGMLHLDLPETELMTDDAGYVVDAHPADTSYPHTIIEMFMVEANEAVASLFDSLNVPCMRRVHPEPDPLSLQVLSKILGSLGLNCPKNPTRKNLQAILESVKGEDESLAVNLTILQSLQKAQYAPLKIGHYALASSHYAHFTSPIRRYADLLVHRLLDAYLKNSLSSENAPDTGFLTEIGAHITFTEQRADDAENELKDVLLLLMLKDHIGEILDCVVTGVASFGIFLQSKKFGIEGLIRLEDLGPDKWSYEEKCQSIRGKNSGHTVRLGQPMRARINSVNVIARKLALLPEKLLGRAKAAPRKNQKKKAKAKKSQSQKQNRRRRRR